MMPSCDQTGVPIHFHSSTTSGSASLISLRILLRVSPRQSPSSAILFEMSSDADWPWLASDFFIFSSLQSAFERREIEPPESIRVGQDVHLGAPSAGDREANHREHAAVGTPRQQADIAIHQDDLLG